MMITPTRRSFLAGSIGIAAAVVLPSVAIAGLTPVETLTSLAAEGKYASVVHQLPWDVNTVGFQFSLNGEQLPPKTYIEEVYAPGDDSGWAVVIEYTKDKPHIRSTRLVHGNWKMWREDVG